MSRPPGLPGLHPALLHHVVNTLQWGSLRPLQEAAVGPLLAGDDAILLAPTAGGKTEAAVFPLLSRMEEQRWRGLSVLYLTPLRALLNNLEPRLAGYAGWLGRRAGLWHGDTPASARRRLAFEPPDVLLTTPESLESMLVSTLTRRDMFADVRAVVVDEVHAFAGDDRGWHLLAVVERMSHLAGRPLQRIGLSATVGNPEALLGWLQGSNRGTRTGQVVTADDGSPGGADVGLDFVGGVANAATVIASLHHGEKRLVFADSRRTVESLAVELRARGTETYVSHSSLAVDERSRAETAFSEARDCVIVSTSTLELGIDVGDLDRVVQVGAPSTVASFLQRLGRTGRRPGTARNMLFLTTTDQELLQSRALLQLWGEGFVEPVAPPPVPRHVLGQQLLALCLQEGRVGDVTWPQWLGGLELATAAERSAIAEWLVSTGHLDRDAGMLFIGPETERRYGRRHFLELLSVFTADPQFAVIQGRDRLGSVDPMVLTRRVDGPLVISLGGRSWSVTHVDWTRRRLYVEPSTDRGSSRWSGIAQPLSFAMTDAMRRVLLGAPGEGFVLWRRAEQRLAAVREDSERTVDPAATVVAVEDRGQVRWWTWAGARANSVLAAALGNVAPDLVDGVDRFDNRYLRLRDGAAAADLREALRAARLVLGTGPGGVEPSVSDEALRQLKFADLLPPRLAAATLGARAADHPAAVAVSGRPVVDGVG